MSETQFLSDEQIEELTVQLHKLRDDLKKSLESTRSGSKPVDLDEPIGRLSRIDAIQQHREGVPNARQERSVGGRKVVRQ
jgi:DnaK suppressor protein